jgi:hypothetical protein
MSKHGIYPQMPCCSDRHGVILQQMRVDARERKLAWVSLEDISLHSEAH